MGKLQPNFSWQKYEGEPEDQQQQFQYQLQSQHIQVANSVNTTIDDSSYFLQERQTSFTWVDGKAIWTKTLQGTIVGTATTAVPHGIKGTIDTVISIGGSAQFQKPLTANHAVPLPYLDPSTLANGVGLFVTPTAVDIVAPNNSLNNYLYSITITYTKTKT